MGILIRIGGLRLGSSRSGGVPAAIKAKFLFWGKVSEISGGQMPNKVTGATDYLTITGTGLNARYRTPDAAAYRSADTDNCWWKTDASESTCDGNRLIAYDFARTLVKYDNTSPYTIREIIILKAGEVLTTAEMNYMRDYMDLSIWWNGLLSAYGNLKGNRGAGQSVWTAESVGTAPTVTTTAISAITNTTATSGGNVTDDGGDTVTARGVCWSTSTNPTTADSKTTNGTGEGVFASAITGLTANTVYHVRAYATNSIGTSYGAEVDFTSLEYLAYDMFTDTNDVALSAHTMNIGTGWAVVGGDWKIAGNKAAVLTDNPASGVMTYGTGRADIDVSFDVVIPAVVTTYAVGMFLRYQDSTHKWTLALENDGAYPYIDLKCDASTIRAYQYVDSAHAGEAFTIRALLVGNSLKIYANGTLRIDVNNATYNDKTKMGFFMYVATPYINVPIDNFKVS